MSYNFNLEYWRTDMDARGRDTKYPTMCLCHVTNFEIKRIQGWIAGCGIDYRISGRCRIAAGDPISSGHDPRIQSILISGPVGLSMDPLRTFLDGLPRRITMELSGFSKAAFRSFHRQLRGFKYTLFESDRGSFVTVEDEPALAPLIMLWSLSASSP